MVQNSDSNNEDNPVFVEVEAEWDSNSDTPPTLLYITRKYRYVGDDSHYTGYRPPVSKEFYLPPGNTVILPSLHPHEKSKAILEAGDGYVSDGPLHIENSERNYKFKMEPAENTAANVVIAIRDELVDDVITVTPKGKDSFGDRIPNDEGEISLDLYPGEYRIESESNSLDTTFTVGDDANQKIKLDYESAKHTFQVVDSDGNPVEQIEIRIKDETRTTNSNGEFDMIVPVEDEVSFVIASDDFDEIKNRVELDSRSPTKLPVESVEEQSDDTTQNKNEDESTPLQDSLKISNYIEDEQNRIIASGATLVVSLAGAVGTLVKHVNGENE